MKKYISLIMVFIMLFSLAACSSNDDPTIKGPSYADGSNASGNNNASLAAFSGKLAEPYAKIIASGNYVFEASAEGESTITLALYGDNMSITTAMDILGDGSKVLVSFVKLDGKYYCALPSEKAKEEVDKQTLEDNNFTQLVNNVKLDNILSGTYKVGTTDGTANPIVTEDGKEYQYEDYYVPVLLTTYRFIFDSNGTLVMLGTQVTGQDMYLMNISFYEATEDTFNVIRSYSDVNDLDYASAGGTQGASQTAN